MKLDKLHRVDNFLNQRISETVVVRTEAQEGIVPAITYCRCWFSCCEDDDDDDGSDDDSDKNSD